MEKIDKFELMLMDSNINILGLPDGAVEQIVELMAKCYTTRNEEVVKMVEESIESNHEAYRQFGLSEFKAIANDMSIILTKLKEDKK